MTVQDQGSILSSALDYAARGWRVFPCDPGHRKPKAALLSTRKDADGKAIPGSGWIEQASSDPDKIRAWWKRWPDALIGAIPGAAGAFVIDLDPKGEPIEAVEARLVEAIGAPLPDCPRTRTQSGGIHLWFRKPAGKQFGNHSLGLDNIDIRVDGGYVIVAPSRMLSGASYEWIGGRMFDETAPEVPARVVEIIEARKNHEAEALPQLPAAAPVQHVRPDNPAEVARRRYALSMLDGIGRDIATTQTRRGTALYAGAAKAGRMVACGVISDREALAVLQDAADACGLTKKDGPQSVAREIANGLSEGRADPDSKVRDKFEEIGREAEERAGRRAVRPPPVSSEDDYGEVISKGTGASAEQPDDEPFDDGEIEDDADLPVSSPANPDKGTDISEKLRKASALDHSDTDNGKRLIIYFGDDLRVMALEGERNFGYLVWTGRYWDMKFGPDAAVRMAQRVGDYIQLEADFLVATPAETEAIAAGADAAKALDKLEAETPRTDWTDAQKAKAKVLEEAIDEGKAARAALDRRKVARRKFGISSKNKSRVEAMLQMAAPHLTVPSSAWNANAYRFATRSHTHVWETTGDPDNPRGRRLKTVSGHNREDMLTRILDIEYDPDAQARRWRGFLDQMLRDGSVIAYVQTFNGLCLTGIPIQKLLFHYGFGANGKSIFLEVMSRVLSELSVTLAAETVSGTAERNAQGATPDLARLYSRWAVRIPELPKGVPLRESLVKTLTGGEAIPVRNLFKGMFEFVPVAKPQGSGNGYPTLDGSDYGMMRRLSVVFWPVTVAEEDRRDFNDMVDEFMQEASGILNWLIDGALMYFDQGLQEPDKVKAATADLKSEMDPVGRFKEACIRTREGARVQAREMFIAYENWCNANSVKPFTEARFGRIMKTKLATVEDRLRYYVDVELHDVPAKRSAWEMEDAP